MNILIVEPYFSGSHKSWALSYQAHSKHHVEIISLPGRHWKWRMHGAAISLAKMYNALSIQPDLILATDMLDLSTFLALVKRDSRPAVAFYFHENQFVYPQSKMDSDIKASRDNHYGWINYVSALSADRVFFNSQYNHDSFFDGVSKLLKRFPDHNELQEIDLLRSKSTVLPVGIDLSVFDDLNREQENKEKVILWNHRWEHDKGPELFFDVLDQLKNEAYQFKLNIVGENFSKIPEVFHSAKAKYEQDILNWGYIDSKEEYRRILKSSDILPVTSEHDFFGISVIEAIYAGCTPLLPNALVYPEHLVESDRSVFLYNGVEELKQKLRLLLNQDGDAHKVDTSLIERYDWSLMAPNYDDYLKNCLV